MLDARQAALGERLAANPPAWTVEAWGAPPGEPRALRDDWQRRAGLVESYREAAGITDPQQAIGPVPSGKAHLAEAFHASVRALELADEAALLRAMNQGQLEAQVQEYARAEAVAPADVQAQVGDLEHSFEEARTRKDEAELGGNLAAAETAETEAADYTRDLARLAVADAARREWREATVAQEAAAREATAELQRRGLAERIPVTDAEVAEVSAQPRPFPEIDPAEAARWKAEQQADRDAYRQAEAEKWADRIPVTDAELERAQANDAERAEAEKDGRPRVSPERAADEANLAEVRAELERVGELIDRIPDREAERQAQRAEIAAEPGIRPEPEAEPSLEPSWQPGDAGGHADAEADFELEI